METASLPRSKPRSDAGRTLRSGSRALQGRRFEVLGCFVLVAGALAAYFLLRTYPIFDGYYSLVWSREILEGTLPSFDAWRAPTEHPSTVFYGLILEPIFGTNADRVLVLSALLSFAALAAAAYRIAQLAFGRVVGVVAALLVVTRFDFIFLALRAYVDIPYLALVFWAAALEMSRPRRGVVVFVMLAIAGLMRPEGWLIAGIYLIYMGWNASWRERAGYLALTAIGPVVWFGLDWIVTGNPLFSLTSTREFVESVGRSRALWQLPIEMAVFSKEQLKTPVLGLAVVGYVLAFWRFRGAAAIPLALVAIGTLRFLLGGAMGFAVISRYLAVMSVGLCIFAAFALFGWIAMGGPEGRPAFRPPWRKLWVGFCVLGLAVLGLYTYRAQRSYVIFAKDVTFQSDIHRSFRGTLENPQVQRALAACPTLMVPTHKWVPDGRFIVDVPRDSVIAMSNPNVEQLPRHGVAVYAFGRKAWNIYGHAENVIGVRPFIGEPLPGFTRVKDSKEQYTVAYVNCPSAAGAT